ncbi:MAG TPA: prepilin-type N-terminal cleavage/methylation domain-containing protein [bacterium]
MGHGRDAGFTMIEVMVSLAIFAIGMLGISSMQLMGLRANVYTDQYSTATRLAMEMLERVNNYALNSLNFDNGAFQLPGIALAGWQDKITAELGDDASGTTGIAYDAVTRLNTVTVAVQWTGDHQVAFTSRIAQ